MKSKRHKPVPHIKLKPATYDPRRLELAKVAMAAIIAKVPKDASADIFTSVAMGAVLYADALLKEFDK